MASEFFKGIGKIPFEGPASANPLAFRYYEPDRKIMGKRMEDHLRCAVAYWHAFASPGADMFGPGTFERPWFDVAAFATLWTVLVISFGRFEQHKPAWRRLLKFAVLLSLLLPLVTTAGRLVAYGVLALFLGAGAAIHFAVLSRFGINGWTGEPQDLFEALLHEMKRHGETRTLLRLARGLPPWPT